jgi:hypothetical protein
LNREQRCAGVEVEGGIEVLLGDFAEHFGVHPGRIRHQDVQATLFVEDSRDQLIQVDAVGDVAGDGAQAVSDHRFSLVQLASAAAHDEDVGAFVDEPLCGRQPDTAAAAGDHRDLAGQSHDQLILQLRDVCRTVPGQ